MESVIRAAAIYLFLLLLFRLSGKRSLAQITTFDFVLLLIISEATQQGMLGNDQSLLNAFFVVLTLVGLDLGLSLLKSHLRPLEKWLDDAPLILVENGRPLAERLRKSRVDEEDVLAAARQTRGLERMEQIKYAVLEREGHISIIPQDSAGRHPSSQEDVVLR